MILLAWIAFVLAAFPAALGLVNLALYRRLPPARADGVRPKVSLLIPMRDEAKNVDGALGAALRSTGVELEVVVLDDGSTDGTAERVAAWAARDPRVRLERAPPPPPGWAGKQHACHILSTLARHDLMVFLDADVRLAPDALARLAAHLDRSSAGLVTGFPHQIAAMFGEKLVVPMILFLLLGYLPMLGLKASRFAAFGAGCGQLMAARRDDYRRAGGHAAIRWSWHDGLTLPRAFRRAGIWTDLIDASDVASCRMYEGMGEVWRGFRKNAVEGMATPVGLPVWSALLFGGHVLPFVLLAAAPFVDVPAAALGPIVAACAASLGFRLLLAARFRQPPLGALLHPLGVLATLGIQADALARSALGRQTAWRGRTMERAS